MYSIATLPVYTVYYILCTVHVNICYFYAICDYIFYYVYTGAHSRSSWRCQQKTGCPGPALTATAVTAVLRPGEIKCSTVLYILQYYTYVLYSILITNILYDIYNIVYSIH